MTAWQRSQHNARWISAYWECLLAKRPVSMIRMWYGKEGLLL